MARSFLILHGYEGSGPEHWQSWLAGRLREAGETVAYPDLPDPFTPQLPAWREALARELRALPGEPTVIAHSLACVLWLHHCAVPVVARRARRARAARRAAVARPARPTPILPFFPVPLDPAAVAAAAGATRLVCARDDPYCPEDAGARCTASRSGSRSTCSPAPGTSTPTRASAPWPEAEAWCYGASAIASSRIAPG